MLNNDHLIQHFCAAGLHLVSIPPDSTGKPTKAPRITGWNQPRSSSNPNGYSANVGDFADCDGFNFGLYHGASNTLALDLDNVELARVVFEELTDFQLMEYLESEQRAEVKSPKANRGKLLFKLPKGFANTGVRQFKHDGKVIFELRSGNCQDVIYGQHPEGGDYQFIGNPAAIPEAPAVLLDMLQHWDEWKRCFVSVLGSEPEPPPAPSPQLRETLHGWRDPIQEFKQSYRVSDVLQRNGYRQKGRDRFIRPGSESNAPGVAIMRHCADDVERIYSHGGDALNDSYAHDAFDCFRLLEHGGDFNKALAWNPDITQHNQRLYMQQTNPIKEVETGQNEQYTPFSLADFSLTGQSSIMVINLLETKHVLNRLAILGQATVIYAKPNTGKTLLVLWLLMESIRAKTINGETVFYINADDTYEGLIEKLKLAEQYGFHMLAPGHNGFESKHLLEYIQKMIVEQTAHGKIIILDTLKKFTDLMDKKSASEFMKVGRQFVTCGGTLILLAHTNKNRSAEGKVVFGGTSDIVDDVDCAYTLDEVGTAQGQKSVLFENLKMRGNVALEAGFSYSNASDLSYIARLNSIKPLDSEQAAQIKHAQRRAERRAKDESIIKAILEALGQGDMQKTELISNVQQNAGFSRAKITKVLTDYEGKDYAQGHRWHSLPAEKNAKIYSALQCIPFIQGSASENRAAMRE